MDFGEGCDEMVQYLSIRNDLHPEVRYDIMHMVYVLLPRFGKEGSTTLWSLLWCAQLDQ